MKKVKFLLLSIFLLIGILSCGSKDPREEIKIVYRSGATWDPWFASVKRAYEEANPAYRITLMPITASESDYYAKATLMLQTDKNLDIIMEDTFILQTDVQAGYLARIENIEAWDEWDYFYDGVKGAGLVDGHLYGIPFVSDTRGLFYNQEILASVGIELPWQPDNWQDIIDVAHKIKAAYPNIAPISMYGGKGEATTMQTFQMLLYGTQDTMYEQGKWVVSSQGMRDTMAFIDYMAKNELMLGPEYLITPAGLGAMWDEKFAKSEIAILLDGNWITGWGFDYHPQGREYALELYSLAKMPKQYGGGYTTMSGGWVFTISQLSSKKEKALDFIKFATSKEQLLTYFRSASDIAPRRDVASDPLYQAYDPLRVIATEFLDFAHYRPANIDYPSVSVELYTAVESVVLGNRTAVSALETYANNVTRLVGSERVVSR